MPEHPKLTGGKLATSFDFVPFRMGHAVLVDGVEVPWALAAVGPWAEPLGDGHAAVLWLPILIGRPFRDLSQSQGVLDAARRAIDRTRGL